MNMFQGFIIAIVVVMCSYAIAGAGAMDRSFYMKDTITGKTHSVTKRSLKMCEGKAHYSIVTIDGVDRRCIKGE